MSNVGASYTTPIDWKDLLATRSLDSVATKQRVAKNELDRSDFLQLLAAQLQYQNPLEPMSDTEFVAQLAQFNSLQQMEQLNTTMTNAQYYNMVGKYVYAELNVAGQLVAVSGVVDSVFVDKGVTYFEVGGQYYEAAKFNQVYDKDLFTGGLSLLEAGTLIGRQVEGLHQGEDGDMVKVTGKITRVEMEKGILTVTLDGDPGKKLYAANITVIADAAGAEAPEPDPDPDPAP
ncbi:MAG: hypothetical protein GXX99_02310 [Clostridiales bacterium]|nr:hypothetical protein [Clostridiales bacterium]